MSEIKTSIPGIKAKEVIVSDNCRLINGKIGAGEIAIKLLQEEYEKLCEIWPVGKKVIFHFVLTIDRSIKKEN